MDNTDRTEMSALRAEVRALTRTVDLLSVKFDNQSELASDAKQLAQDHETRLRSVERWKAALPVSTIITMATLAIGVFALLTRG